MADAAKPESETATGGGDLDVDIEKDTLTHIDEPPGVAGIYAGKASAAAADDIGDKVINATNGKPFEILIAKGGSILADTEIADALRFEIAALRDRLAGVQLDTRAVLSGKHVEGLQTPKVGHSTMLTAKVSGALVKGALPAMSAGIGLVSKLMAHQYTTSSATLEHVALGMDLRIAGVLRAKVGDSKNVQIYVERFWQPSDSELVDDLTELAHAREALTRKVARAAALAEETKVAVEDVTAAKAAGRALLSELSKSTALDKSPTKGSSWSLAWDYARSLADAEVGDVARERGEAVAALAELKEILSDLETFLASTLATPSGGTSTLARARRAEWLSGDASRVLLYVGPLAAGVDQVLETKLGPDRRVVLAGSSVEYAAVAFDTRLMFAGVFDNLWGGTMKLDKLAEFNSARIDYLPVANARRVEPTS